MSAKYDVKFLLIFYLRQLALRLDSRTDFLEHTILLNNL